MPVAADGIRRLLWYRWIVLVIVSLSGILMYFHFAWGATLSGYHVFAWDLEARHLGLLTAMGFLPYALMQIPGGYLTDLLGARKMLSLSATVLSLSTAAFATAPTFTIAAVSRMLIGLGAGVIMVASLKVLASWFRTREFATIQGIYMMVGTAGGLLATLPLAIAAERWGWRISMLVVAGLTAFIVTATWLLLRNDPRDLGLPSIRTIDPETAVAASSRPKERPSFRTGLRAWRRSTTLWTISILLFASTGSLWTFQALWAGPLLRHVRGLSVTETGGALLLFTLGAGLGPVLFGFISDRVVKGRRPVVIFAVVTQAALWIIAVLTFARLPLSLLYAVFATLSALAGGVLVTQVMVKELCPPYLLGTVFGLINGSGFYGTAILQVITGAILDAIGPVRVQVEPIYSAQAYALGMSPLVFVMLIASLFSFKLSETLARGEGRQIEP